MALAHFGQAQRQFAVAAQALVEDHHRAGAVHRLQGEGFLLLLHPGEEHVFAEFFPVAGFFPQHPIDQLRGFHFLIAAGIEAAAHVVFRRAVELPAFRVPEHAAGGLFLDVEQAHILADAAMVALFRLGQHVQMRVQFFLVAPGGAVDAAEHAVAVVAAPIGAGGAHQLEGGADIAGAAHMRATAEVDPVALAVEGDGFAGRQVADQFGFVGFALVLEEGDGVFARQHAAFKGGVAGDDLAHFGFDGGEIVGGERHFGGEVVIEAVFDRRADGDLGAGEQRLHRFGQHMGAIVADHFQRHRVFAGDEGDGGVGGDFPRQIHQHLVHLHRQSGAGEAGADIGGDGGPGHWPIKTADGTVGQGDRGHGEAS